MAGFPPSRIITRFVLVSMLLAYVLSVYTTLSIGRALPAESKWALMGLGRHMSQFFDHRDRLG